MMADAIVWQVLRINNPLDKNVIDPFIDRGLRALSKNCNGKRRCAQATGINRKAGSEIYTGLCYALDEMQQYDMFNCVRHAGSTDSAYILNRDEL